MGVKWGTHASGKEFLDSLAGENKKAPVLKGRLQFISEYGI